jgi:hypothetical protein
MTKMVSSLPALDNCRLEGFLSSDSGRSPRPSQNLAKALECISASFRAHKKGPFPGLSAKRMKGLEPSTLLHGNDWARTDRRRQEPTLRSVTRIPVRPG